MKALIIALFLSLFAALNAQSGWVIHGGLGFGTTGKAFDKNHEGYLSGWNLGLTSRFGKNVWYLRTGIEYHKYQITASHLLKPFAPGPSFSFLVMPLQAGTRLLKKEYFLFRVFAGLYTSYLLQVDDNTINLNYNTLTDFQFGGSVGIGIDLGPLAVDVAYGRGLTWLNKADKTGLHFTAATIGFLF